MSNTVTVSCRRVPMRLDEDELRGVVVQVRRRCTRPYGAPLCIFSTGVTRSPQPASTVPENFAFQFVKSLSVRSFGFVG